MPLNLAQACAWNLATTLMVCVVLIGDLSAIVYEYDPYAF